MGSRRTPLAQFVGLPGAGRYGGGRAKAGMGIDLAAVEEEAVARGMDLAKVRRRIGEVIQDAEALDAGTRMRVALAIARGAGQEVSDGRDGSSG